MQHLAHWTISQRSNRVDLPIKADDYRGEKTNYSGSAGEQIRTARMQAGLTRDQLSKLSGIPTFWLGRWERNRSIPNQIQWQQIAKKLPILLSPTA